MTGIILDANVISGVFTKPSQSGNFALVAEQLFSKKCVMVYGGSKYSEELGRMSSYLKLINDYKFIGKIKVKEIDKKNIDALEISLKKNKIFKKCDDHHIVAILAISGCRLVFTNDLRSKKYVFDKTIFPASKPKILCSRTNKKTAKDLLKKCSTEKIQIRNKKKRKGSFLKKAKS